uniref:uncharacterized protein LOC124048498 isoform X2 n=1 Tax=Oncorhynchus gorbuscha TaxID=8017 RepID=UPI001EAEA8A3|nr:uncharacterized protein LOC124048498 isoform X2 [Oncorhynchus gorbuscha]
MIQQERIPQAIRCMDILCQCDPVVETPVNRACGRTGVACRMSDSPHEKQCMINATLRQGDLLGVMYSLTLGIVKDDRGLQQEGKKDPRTITTRAMTYSPCFYPEGTGRRSNMSLPEFVMLWRLWWSTQ